MNRSRRFQRLGELPTGEGRPRRRSVRVHDRGPDGPGRWGDCSRNEWRASPAFLPPDAPSDPHGRSDARRQAPAGSSTRNGACLPACRSRYAARNRTGVSTRARSHSRGSKGDSRTPRSRRGRRRSSSGRRSSASVRIQPGSTRRAVRRVHGRILPVSCRRSSEARIRSRHFARRHVAARVPVEAQPWPARARSSRVSKAAAVLTTRPESRRG